MRLIDLLKQGKHISVLIIPDGDNRTFGFRLSSAAFRIMGSVAVVVLIAVLIGGMTYWRVARVAFRAGKLEEENGLLRRENAKVMQLQKTLYEMKEIDHRLRMMAGGKSGPDIQILEEETDFDRDYFQTAARRVEEYPLGRVLGEGFAVEMSDTIENSQRPVRTTPNLWPVQGWVTAEFSIKMGPFGRRHAGIDIAAPSGSPVKAAADGVVIFAGWTEGLGNLAILQHDASFSTRYGHNSKILVGQGEWVRRGQTIAFVGNSGRSSAPHLHFEIWKEGCPVNPRDYLVQ